MIDELRDHIIVCGCGRIGRSAADELRTRIATVRKLGGAIDLRPTKDTLLELVDAIVRFGSVDEIRKLELFEPGTAARA